MRLQDKVAVITGGASGMGLATAQRFLAEGAKVVIADFNVQTGEAAAAAAEERGFGDSSCFIRTDVANEDEMVRAIELARARFGRLDIIFNNAGVGGAIGPLTETTVEDWDLHSMCWRRACSSVSSMAPAPCAPRAVAAPSSIQHPSQG